MAKHYNTQNDSASLSAFFFYVHNVISLLIIVLLRLPCPPLAKRLGIKALARLCGMEPLCYNLAITFYSDNS